MDEASPSIEVGDRGSGSKVIVITPDQIKKMGLESDVKSAAIKTDKKDDSNNLILNIRSKLSTLLKPVEKPKPKSALESKGAVTYKKVPLKSDRMPMGKLTRITMVKDKTVTSTYADKALLIMKPESRPPIDSRILSMRSMLSKKMGTEKSDEKIIDLDDKSETKKTTSETEKTKTRESSANQGASKRIKILSVVPLNSEGKLNESKEEKKDSINLESIDFVEDDTVHESKSAVPILHFRNASGAVIELFQETEPKSDEEEDSVASQGTDDSEKREENGSTFEDIDESDSDVDRSKFKSYLKYSKFKRTKPVNVIKISREKSESTKSNEAKLSDEETKDIVELKPVPIHQRTTSNASAENKKTIIEIIHDDESDVNSESDEDDDKNAKQTDEDGLKPILKRKMSTISVSDDSPGVPIKRGRGRPRKSTSEGGTSDPKKVTPKVVKKKILLAPDGTPIVKKRGRPPKVWNQEELIKTTPTPKIEVTSVKTYSKKVPIASMPLSAPRKSALISNTPSMIKLEIEIGEEASVVITDEQKQEKINTPENSTEEIEDTPTKPSASSQSTPISVPRKRGRPRKSAVPVTPETTPSPKQPKVKSSPSPREVVVSRSGRKRKKIDYSAMNEGQSNSDDSYAEDDPPTKQDKTDRDFDEFPPRSSFNKDYEHKVYPAKRKSFKSDSDTNENDPKEDESSTKPTSADVTTADVTSETNKESNNTTQDNSDPKKTDETLKKKRGRPRKNPLSTSPKIVSDSVPSPQKSGDPPKTPDASLPESPSKHTSDSTPSIKKSEPETETERDISKQIENGDDTGKQDKEETKSIPQSRKKEVSVDSAFACMFNMVAKEADGPHPINIHARTDFSAKSPPAEDRGTVVCALCESEVPMKSFSRHNLTKHNNLAWTVGDTVLDLSNYGLVLGVYTDIYKAREKFICDRKCGITKKSIMGYLSHYIVCRKSAEEVEDMKKPCESCQRLIMPFYYVNHLKDCKKDTGEEPEKAKRKYIKRNLQLDAVQPAQEEIPTLSIQQVLTHMLEVIKSNKAGVNAINVYLRMDLEDLEKRELPANGQAICALCNMEMESSKFKIHNLTSHNNLSWKIGEPKLELDKYEFVIPTLNTMYTQRHQFNCEQCSSSIKSVWGFLWHVSICGKEPKEVDKCKLQCPKCSNPVVPTNYIAHTRNCTKSILAAEEATELNSDGEPEPTTKKQRAAATKASKFIQELTTIDDAKGYDYDVLNFFYVDHKFLKTKKLEAFIKTRIANDTNCIFKNCDYNNSDVDLLVCHLFACLKKPKKNFTCKLCFSIFETAVKATAHMNNRHKNKLEPDELSAASSASSASGDEENNTTPKQRRKKRKEPCEDERFTSWQSLRLQNLQLYKTFQDTKVQLSITKQLASTFPIGYKWNLEFLKQNFSSVLYSFNESFSTWKSVLPANIVSYLPKLRTSFDATFIEASKLPSSVEKLNIVDWVSLKLFESRRVNDTWTLFCGGPVHSMAWAPTYFPDEKDDTNVNFDQYLAVNVLSDPDSVMRQGQIKAECALLQIWNFGPIEVNKSMFQPDDFKPHLDYCLAHKHGDYCCIEWCPSGGFDKKLRLGLLAVGGSDTFVHIYEMPLGNALNKECSIIFNAKPKYKLECMKLNEMDFTERPTIPTSISWTKAKDHRYIAVGYCCGLIALFDIFTESPHLKTISPENVVNLKPYLVTAGHTGAVTALSLHYMHGGNRWLASFSFDKTHKLWDLENHSQPIYTFTKQQMVDGIWPTHWLTTIMSYDDNGVRGSGGSTGIFFPIKQFTGTYFHFYNYFTRTNSIAVSDWSNMITYCNFIGHVMGGFVNTCIPTATHYQSSVRNFNISFTDVIDKTKSLDDEVQEEGASKTIGEIKGFNEELTYAPAKKRYGIVFCDASLNSSTQLDVVKKSGSSSSKIFSKFNENYSPNMYPIRSATKAAINPNQQAHSYIAVGYQLGFVRIFCPYLYKDKK